jgi:hypothetical protein
MLHQQPSTGATWLHHVEGLARPDTSKLGDRASSASMSINRRGSYSP